MADGSDYSATAFADKSEQSENWQKLGWIAMRIVEEKARQRANAPGMTASNERNGDD